jgi:DNA-binding PadR family transcriptional regulator
MNEQFALTESTYYILLALCRPSHGYGIMQQVEEMSQGRIRLAAGTLYGALSAMCDKGWIIQLPVEEGSRRKDYRMTQKGMAILEKELARLRELVRNGEEIIGGEEK